MDAPANGPLVDMEELLSPRILSVPSAVSEYGITRTGEPVLPPRPPHFSSYDGATAYLRVVFAGSPIRGWDAPVTIGDVCLVPRKGPVWVQRTDITQPVADNVDYEKVHHRVETGHGRHLTIGLLPFTIDTTHMTQLMVASAQKVAAAAGILAALTDERFAFDVLGQNVLVTINGEVCRIVDMTTSVRNYLQDYSLNDVQSLPKGAIHADVARSARWYLKGAREGPTPEGIVWLCTAIECLVDPPSGQRKKFNKKTIERAVEAAGDDPTRFDPDLGRVAGLRTAVVHYGEESPERLRDGYLVLEEVCRLLIRSRIGEVSGWPCSVPDPEPSAKPAVVKGYLHGLNWVHPPDVPQCQ